MTSDGSSAATGAGTFAHRFSSGLGRRLIEGAGRLPGAVGTLFVAILHVRAPGGRPSNTAGGGVRLSVPPSGGS
jgi:hypothetical protein